MISSVTRLLSITVSFGLIVSFTILLQGCSGGREQLSEEGLSQLITSPNDQRHYRHIRLANKLDVLLISDPTTDKSAASLDVYVGSYQNPQDREGLAHFLEHMLFLGTEQYPESGEYQTFIAEHGGSHNAGTGLENTTYFFDIDAQYLEQALDRFAPFFHSPNFDAKYVERERNAVESEYRLKIKDDGRRQWDVLQEQVDPSHPMAKFTVGNLQTLADLNDRPIRAELLTFYQQYYSANLMKLVVLGAESLDELEALVTPRFSPIANNQIDIPMHSARLMPADQSPLLIEVKPLKELRELSISFQLPKMQPHWRVKPARFLAALIGHEGPGSLLQLLKTRGWADSLSAGAGLEDRSSSLFMIDIGLTPEGYKHHEDITELVFSWIKMIQESGVEEWRYKEQASLATLAFRFQEKQNPMRYASSLASSMQHFPVTDVLRANYLMEQFDQSLIRQVAQDLVPENSFVMLTAPEVATEQLSKRYQVPYRVRPISKSTLDKWRNPTAESGLAVAVKNPYIPTNLALIDSSDQPVPALLSAGKGINSWHLADSRFGVPKADIIGLLGTDKTASLEGLAMAELYLDLVRDQLNAAAYPAAEAGLNFGLSVSARALRVAVAGYSDKQDVLLEDVLRALTQLNWNQSNFERLKQKRLRSLANFQREYPFRQVMSGLYSMLSGRWTPLQKMAVIEAVSMPQLKEFSAQLLSSVELQLLVSGNHSKKVAKSIEQQFARNFTLVPVSNPSSIAKLENGPRVGQIPVDHADSVAVLYLQGERDGLQQMALVSLLAEMLSAPFYNSLRTEKQLGYVVSAFASNLDLVPGLTMLVQSPIADEVELRREFELFIDDFAEDVERLSEADLQRYKDSLLSSLTEKPKNLGELNGRFMESLKLGYKSFDFRTQLAAAINDVSVASLQKSYQQIIANDSRRLWVTTAAMGEDDTAIDLRIDGQHYRYDF